MKILYISLLMIFTLPEAFSQEFQWVTKHNLWNSSGIIRTMDTDYEGNVFSVGDSKVTNISGSISKIDNNGNLKWEYELYTKSKVRGKALKADSEGNCIGAFIFTDTIHFRNQYFVSENPATLILKLNKQGDVVWHYIINGSIVNHILTDSDDNIYLSGSVNYSVFPDTLLQYQNNNNGNYFLKLNKNGNYQWVKQVVLSAFHSYYSESFSCIEYFTDSITYNGTTYYADDYTETGFLLVGADKNYNVKWAKQFTTEYKRRFSIMDKTIDNQGNIIITGHSNKFIIYAGDTIFSYQPNPQYQYNYQDIFLFKIDSSGNFLWARKGQSPQPLYSEAVTTDTSGNVFITGFFKSEMTLESTTIYGSGMFIAKYDRDGNLIWLTKPEGGGSAGTAMASDSFGNVYFGGKYGGEVSFGPHTLSGSGIMVGKIAWEAAPPASLPNTGSKEQGSLFIYPNPSSNQLHIQFTVLNKSENATLNIYNSTGVLVYSQNFSSIVEYLPDRQAGYKRIDISGFSQGVYLLNVLSGKDKESRKFVISR